MAQIQIGCDPISGFFLIFIALKKRKYEQPHQHNPTSTRAVFQFSTGLRAFRICMFACVSLGIGAAAQLRIRIYECACACACAYDGARQEPTMSKHDSVCRDHRSNRRFARRSTQPHGTKIRSRHTIGSMLTPYRPQYHGHIGVVLRSAHREQDNIEQQSYGTDRRPR